jgi:uncharacterized repeat protein (TIGR04138 family)
MSLRNSLARVMARDPRYSIQAYAFVFEALEYTKRLASRPPARRAGRTRQRASAETRHVTGQDLCEGARKLALESYGLMALTVLRLWGIRSTFDIGEIVYNLIASGDLEKTPTDSRSDFDRVYDFEKAFHHDFVLQVDEVS